MQHPATTVAVVPRETFSRALESLDRVLGSTDRPFRLVYVDGRSPRPIARELARRAAAEDFTLLRSETYLTPNEARNLALSVVDTPYVVFVDNDLFPDRGWLSPLEVALQETDAAIVGPLYCIGDPENGKIHMAGGRCRIVETDGRRSFEEEHFHADEHRSTMTRASRSKTELVEFHCMAVRTDYLREAGGLDERMLCTNEHCDVCLEATASGETVWFEPRSVVTYSPPSHLAWSDIPYFCLRWSDAWLRESIWNFTRKWGLEAGDSGISTGLRWAKVHRSRAVEVPLPTVLAKPLVRLGRPQRHLPDRVLRSTVVAWANRRRRRTGGPVVSTEHAASWMTPV